MGSRNRLGAGLVISGGVAVALVAAVAAVAAVTQSGSGTKACGATVKVTDHEKFVVNRYALDAMRYVPGTATVRSGCTLRFTFATPDQDVPHSISIVKKSELPKTAAEMQSCKVCKEIKAEHVKDPTEPAGPHNPILHWIVNVGRPGLDVPGDSISIFEDADKGAPPGHKSVAIRVSAPPGTVLHYICGMHPWMQGAIVVT